GNDAEIDFRLAGLGIGRRDSIMAGHRQLETAAKRGSMQSHDHGLGAVLDLLQEIVKVGSARTAAVSVILQLLDVGAGDERPSGADDDHSGYSRIALGGVD